MKKFEKDFRAAAIDLSHCRDGLTPLSRKTPDVLRDDMRGAWAELGPRQRKAAEAWLEACGYARWVKFLLRGVGGLWSDESDQDDDDAPADDDEEL